MSKEGEAGEGHGMKTLWKDMEKQTRAKTSSRRCRSQPGKLSSNHVLISTTSNSSSFGSTHSSTSASMLSNSSDDIGVEPQAAPLRGTTAAASGPTASTGSASSSSGPSGSYAGESSAYPYVVPPGFIVRNTFLEPTDGSLAESAPARLRMLEAEAAILRASMQSSGMAAADPSLEEEGAEGNDHAAASDPQAAAAAEPEAAGAAAKKSTKRPRPPKPKRELAKRLAEHFFYVQMTGSDEELERAQQVFLQETSADMKLYDYAQNVLRRLTLEARGREAAGEDLFPPGPS